jgi:hypothetical protein
MGGGGVGGEVGFREPELCKLLADELDIAGRILDDSCICSSILL